MTSLDWDEHNISCCGTISLFILSPVMPSRPIRDQELGRKSDNQYYRVIALISVNIVPSLGIEGRKLGSVRRYPNEGQYSPISVR